MAGNILGDLTIAFKSDLTNLMSGVQTASNAMRGLSGAGGGMMLPIAGIAALGVAATALGVDSVKTAGDFQASMKKLQSEAGVSAADIKGLTQSVLDMSTQVGQKPNDLAKGLFFIESASFHGKDAITTLRLSAEMAANDMTDLTTIAKGLTTEVKAFGLTTADSAYVSNIMVKAVSDGKMTMADYAATIGKVALTAHGYNVTIQETNAALDTLTNNGFPSAKQAGTGLQNLLVQFDGNTDKLAKNLKKLGIEGFDEVKFKAMSLGDQIKYLNGFMKGHEDQLKSVLGGSRSASQAFIALAGDTKGYANALKDMNDAQKNGGAEAQAFAVTQQGFNFQMAQLGATVDRAKIAIGTALLPALSKIIAGVRPIIEGFVAWENKTHGLETGIKAVVDAFSTGITVIGNINKFFQDNQTAMDALKATGVAVGAVLAVMFAVWAIGAASAAIATIAATWPILAVIAAVALLIFIVILMARHWGDICTFFEGIWRHVWQFMTMIWSAIVLDFQMGVKAIGDFLHAAGVWLYDTFILPWVRAWAYLQFVWAVIHILFDMGVKKVKQILQAGIDILYNTFVAPFVRARDTIMGILGTIQQAIQNVMNNPFIRSAAQALHIPGFASGVTNFGGGYAMVGEHGPELMYLPMGTNIYPSGSMPSPAGGSASSASGQGTPQVIIIHLDSRELGRAVGNSLQKEIHVKTRVGR